MNQTTQMHQIARELPDCNCWFTPYYADGILEHLRRRGILDRTILGAPHTRRCMEYLQQQRVMIDHRGESGTYDLVLTCSDVIIPKNIRKANIVLVQEGMTDPETWVYHLVRTFRFLPRWLCSTASTGLSDAYKLFCVASEGYRDLFIRKGVKPEKLLVTGIPNFDNCQRFTRNNFPHKHFVLVCTSDSRETFGRENRTAFILNAVRIAAGRPLIFKLHPNEDVARATQEIKRLAPKALVFDCGSAEEMIAQCDVLITRYSSTVYVGIALGKEVHTAFDIESLRRMTPIQNGSAAKLIADACRQLLGECATDNKTVRTTRRTSKGRRKSWYGHHYPSKASR